MSQVVPSSYGVVVFVEKDTKSLEIPDFIWLWDLERKYHTRFLWLITPYMFHSMKSIPLELCGLHIHFSANEPVGSWNQLPMRDNIIKDPKKQIELLEKFHREWIVNGYGGSVNAD